MEKKELKGVLQRYTQSLKGASGKTIITNYGKMKDFTYKLSEEELGNELCHLCQLYTIRQALRAVKEENVCLKDCSDDWNSQAVAKGYQLAKKREELYKTQPNSKELTDTSIELATLAFCEPSIATSLFITGLFFSGGILDENDILRMRTLLSDTTELTN